MKVIVLFLLTLLISSVNAESIKIGYIDTDIVVNNLTLYKKGKTNIAQEFESKKQELLDLFEYIKLRRANLEKIDISLNNDIFDKELTKVSELEASFQQETEFWQATINQKQVDLLQELEVIINDAIEEFASEENYDLILYGNAAFVKENIDISNNIILKIENQPR